MKGRGQEREEREVLREKEWGGVEVAFYTFQAQPEPGMVDSLFRVCSFFGFADHFPRTRWNQQTNSQRMLEQRVLLVHTFVRVDPIRVTLWTTA